ncbi:N-acyl homoserine lactonase family protein [Falsibacillus albus]|uniref:N-acyl homoserine lactonase family protein n=1 Tax=Falsibacillus albus TaxID=2478915 RepID=A0A3L7JUZ0_9BACI|nr:N-acyl homoserine lactonase family protein [Falsibacillus albus]RLQ94603.1 N-acyl homoserine lactonase family protein [Falsibacillus albus]
MKINVWHAGNVYIDRSLAFRGKSLHPMSYTGWFRGADKKMWVPVSSYLIEHPKGLILVDTGWHEDMRKNQKNHLGRLAYSMFKGELPAGSSVREKLMEYGISSKDLDFVLLTHLHSDHVSGLEQVKDAKKILTSELEWEYAHKRAGYIKSMWKGIDIHTFPLKEIPFGPFNLGLDLFDDGSIYLVHTPGHSDGMFSILIKMQNGWVLLASDVGYSEKSWNDMILPGVTTNRKDAKKSLNWVKEFSEREDCLRVMANHDPNIQPMVIK